MCIKLQTGLNFCDHIQDCSSRIFWVEIRFWSETAFPGIYKAIDESDIQKNMKCCSSVAQMQCCDQILYYAKRVASYHVLLTNHCFQTLSAKLQYILRKHYMQLLPTRKNKRLFHVWCLIGCRAQWTVVFSMYRSNCLIKIKVCSLLFWKRSLLSNYMTYILYQ